MYTETAYGQFPIWHPDAEIRMMDLENRTAMDMSALNSPDTDSYHFGVVIVIGSYLVAAGITVYILYLIFVIWERR